MAPKKSEEISKSNDRNEYIPSFIAKKPFYIDDATASQEDYLQHQRLQQEKNHDPLSTSKWYNRGNQQGPAATKYRKGACENCGAITHKSKDCLQRKRKLGAKWTGKNIAADEVIEDVKLGWDAKRDRWNGYDAAQYEEVVEDFKSKQAVGDDDGVRYEEETDMGRQQSTATRSLRLREDTAKYLLNLDLDSAQYDPKTRTIQDAVDSKNELIAEEGFQRSSGDAIEFENAQKYAWETQERGGTDKIHLQANPTVAELTRKRKAEEDVQKRESKKTALQEMYGDQTVVKSNPLKDVVATNERYVEYDERGRIKGDKPTKRKSIYVEDIFHNNHTSIWGSWWSDFKWGYACCHSTVKNSFCTGDEGRQAMEEAEAFSRGNILSNTDPGEEPGFERSIIPDSATTDKARQSRGDVSEADMEEYRRQRSMKNDPMSGILGQDRLLDQHTEQPSAVT